MWKNLIFVKNFHLMKNGAVNTDFDPVLVKFYNSTIKVNKCPYCNSSSYYRHGKYKFTYRYKCRYCNKTFIPSTGTSIHHLKKKKVFLEYAEILKNDGVLTLRKLSKRLGIAHLTSFDWRHKILASVSYNDKSLGEEALCKDVWFLYNLKGRKGVGFDDKMFIKNLRDMDKKTSKLIAADGNSGYSIKLTKVGQLDVNDIKRVLGHKIIGTRSLVTNENNIFNDFAKYLKVKHIKIKSEFIKPNEIRLRKFFSFNEDFRYWINNSLRGVATKYIQLYANFFSYCRRKIFNPLTISVFKKKYIWSIFTSMENIYKSFLTNYSEIAYTTPIKRYWKTSGMYFIESKKIPY